MLSSADILRNSADVLEREGVWIKGTFFRKSTTSPIGSCMCAHGAIAYCGDAEIRDTIDSQKATPSQFNSRIDATYGRAQSAVTQKTAPNEELLAQNIEILWAHYRAVEAGCSIGFNDQGDTTKKQVIEKLRHAADIAEANGHNVSPVNATGTFNL